MEETTKVPELQGITITVELANALLQYLATRPYGEVFQIVNALQESEKVLKN